ncbi:unnamed protein product [Phaeothamnion confervicola]
MPPYPLPVLRLARLAVDERARGRGLGSKLLRYCIELAETMMDNLGCVGLLVDSKIQAIGFYEGLGFHKLKMLEGFSPQRPIPTAMFLPLSSVPQRAKTE